MKKVLAILLALIMALSLVACGGATTPSPSPSPSTAPSTEPSPSASAAESASPSASAAGTVGYFTDDVDHNARKTYKIAYLYYTTAALEKAHFTAMQNMQKRLNFTVVDFTANSDADLFIQNMEVLKDQGFDGLIIEPNAETHERIFEVANELEIPFIYTVNAYRDENGANLVPTIILDQHKNGVTQMEWMAEHYKDYWKGDVNPSEIALLSLEFSSNPDLTTRAQGVKDGFAKLFPGNKIIVGDLVGGKLDADNAFNQTSTIISGNTDVKWWWIAGTVEMFGEGAARATEALNITDKTLIVTSGANVLPVQWDAGYKGNWVASYAVYNYNYVVPALTGLIAMMDGRATQETLWKEVRAEGDKATAFFAGDQMVTIDTYKSVQSEIAKKYGVEGA